MKIPHIQGCHPLILKGTEPSLDFCLLCGCIRPTVADDRADPGRQQFHLPVFIGGSIIKVENLWSAVFGDRRFHDGHKIHEGIVKEDIRTKDKTAGIIDQRDHINTMLLSIPGFQIGAGTGITAPYFIDVWSFITPHILIVRQMFL